MADKKSQKETQAQRPVIKVKIKMNAVPLIIRKIYHEEIF